MNDAQAVFDALEKENKEDLDLLRIAASISPNSLAALAKVYPAFLEYLSERANRSARALDVARGLK